MTPLAVLAAAAAMSAAAQTVVPSVPWTAAGPSLASVGTVALPRSPLSLSLPSPTLGLRPVLPAVSLAPRAVAWIPSAVRPSSPGAVRSAVDPVPPAPADGSVRASAEELAFVAGASAELAVLADDLGAERGLKFSKMTGRDFLALLADARALWADRGRTRAPSPRAHAAAVAVQEHWSRAARALLKDADPLLPQSRRLLAVWQVFNQEMQAAAAKGSIEAVSSEAALFADQVEHSI